MGVYTAHTCVHTPHRYTHVHTGHEINWATTEIKHWATGSLQNHHDKSRQEKSHMLCLCREEQDQGTRVLYREVTAMLDSDRCVGVDHTVKGRNPKDWRSSSLLPPTLIPCPPPPPTRPAVIRRNNPGSRGKRNKCSTPHCETVLAC